MWRCVWVGKGCAGFAIFYWFGQMVVGQGCSACFLCPKCTTLYFEPGPNDEDPLYKV